jgi:hypothetical protein
MAHGDPSHPTHPRMYVDESPTTKFKYQAKIDVNRDRNDKTPLRLKALLIELLIQHQNVDPTFHFLPTEDGSTASAITKANEIPNTEEQMKHYVKEMRDSDNDKGNKTKFYTVIFYVKVASSMTLGMMKQDNKLFLWLRDNNIWIRAFHFTTTYDVVKAGFISHMDGGIHNRDRMNNIIKTAMQANYPHIEVQLVPTTIKHGLDARNKRITHVVSLQTDRKHLNDAREALVEVFKMSAGALPKDIFFVPSPANGMITTQLYYDLVNAHHEHMANLRSFAITGIAKLSAPMIVQDNTDANSSVETTLEQIILDAKVPGTDQLIFSSIEPTTNSDTEGRYLLLTDSMKLAHAEHMIDELVKHIATHPEIEKEVSINGEEVRRANRIKVSNAFHGYTDFLVSKVPTVIITNPAQNAWTKRRVATNMDYTDENFPPMASMKKARFATDETNITADSSEPSETVLIDFETEIEKEREQTETRLTEIQQTFMDEISRMKTEFNEQMTQAINASEKRMMLSIQSHIGDIMQSSDAAVTRMEAKSNEITDRILEMIHSGGIMSKVDEGTPRKKQQRPSNDVDVEMHEDTAPANPITPASRESQTQRGMDMSAGEPT